MKQHYLLIFVLFFAVFFSCKNQKATSEKAEWKSIFNGKNLDGWTPKIAGYALGNNYKNTFRVENGILKVSYDNYDTFTKQFGHLFYEKSYQNYRLKLQYRFAGKQVNGGESWATKNSGIMLYCQEPKTMLLQQEFPISLEAQLLGGTNVNIKRPSGNLCTPGTHVEINNEKIIDHCIISDSETFYDDKWIDAEIIVTDTIIEHYINNKLVISYNNPTIGGQFLETASNDIQARSGEKLKGGFISLQSESHPIEFKNIQIMELQ
ncbi:DUF1080 domain-containing protein [Polaribacter sp. MED152]|uniref:3-keto-disaccharide hydrolase n=1 Tax=Polaribacter sp. MED152 TaxID=313598 RepID=UPI000068CD7A|nr:DUF1080 domain-containing protein [Polaribacter sp. MED152]EAQ42088.1 protein of unknown function (DUF1080) [Polaribacter sp. MED152]